MRTAFVHNVGWLIVPFLVIVAVSYLAVVSRLLKRSPARRPSALEVPPSLPFMDLYRLFNILPASREQWPIDQSEANRVEDRNRAKLKSSRRV